jgi:CRISP-associated protein Cas1
MHTLAITEQGTHVQAKDDALLLCLSNKVVRRVRLGDIQQLLMFGRVEITSAALALLVRRKIDVVLLSRQGYFRARLCGPGSPAADLRLAQLRAALDPAFCLRVAQGMIAGKVAHQRQILLRAQRRLQDDDLAVVLGQLRVAAEQSCRQTGLDALRGFEGHAAALYFGQFAKLVLVPDVPFHGRSRRPPRDPVNACLSFGYALLGRVVETEVLRVGLDPYLGFFHQPHHGRPSLMLDLLEEFRPFVDALVLRLVNRRQLGPLDFDRALGKELEDILSEAPEPSSPAQETGTFFSAPCDPSMPNTLEAGKKGACPPQGAPPEQAPHGVFLGDTGRRIFLAEFFKRLRERLHYPPREAAFELRDIIREQVYHLARVIEARDPTYLPFVPT